MIRRRATFLLLTLAPLTLAAACRVAENPERARPPGALGFGVDRDVFEQYRIVDLTHPFDANTVYWPTEEEAGFSLDTLARGDTEGGYFYSAYAVATPEHGGTHLDAPVHFSRRGRATDQIPLEQLMGPAVVIDVSAQTSRDPDYLLSRADVEAFEEEHGEIPQGAIVLLRTGWARYWADGRRYLGGDSASDLHFPSYGEEAARLLVEQRGVAALGADVASIDAGSSSDFPVHRVAAAAQVPGLENLANLASLPPTGALIIALPMKIAGGSGGPLRAVALVPDLGN